MYSISIYTVARFPAIFYQSCAYSLMCHFPLYFYSQFSVVNEYKDFQLEIRREAIKWDKTIKVICKYRA